MSNTQRSQRDLVIWQSKVGLLMKLIESRGDAELRARASSLLGDVKWEEASEAASAAMEAVVKSGIVHEAIALELEKRLEGPDGARDPKAVADEVRAMVAEQRWRPGARR